nr:MAG TPA: hypothetical protein [Caudoviricetes sp.]DAX49400.1 MAG TPA: hypothetical protein [Caudoviricetes sp.]
MMITALQKRLLLSVAVRRQRQKRRRSFPPSKIGGIV